MRLPIATQWIFVGLSLLISGTLPAGPIPTGKPSSYPDWWFERDVIPRLPAVSNKLNPSWPIDYPLPDNYAAANIGQLKHIAKKAHDELNFFVSGGAASDINSLIAGWNPSLSEPTRDDYGALNQGQLKAVAKLYYNRLAAFGYDGGPLPIGQSYPWSKISNDDEAYAVVNIGQLKHIFSFVPVLLYQIQPIPGDGDNDGTPDDWEIARFGSSAAYYGADDPDDDNLNNRSEYILEMNPLQNATTVTNATLGIVVFSPL